MGFLMTDIAMPKLFRWFPRISSHRCALALCTALAGSTLAAQGAPRTNTGLLISVQALAARLSDPTLVVIHANRDTTANEGGQVPGSRFIPLRSLVVERDGVTNEMPSVAQLDSVMESVGISTTSRIVIYGDPLVAARLFVTLDYLGLGGQVSLLDGGLPAWRAANQPTSPSASNYARGRLEPQVQRQLLIDVAELSERMRRPGLALLDARPPAEFSGEVPGDGIARGGHIPGARSFFWRNALTGAGGLFLKDPAELRRLLSDAGLSPGMDVVTYCKTGVQASYLYFVVRYMGYSPRLYDGSYAEWSSSLERAVER
jgi:thiosulfate/3-mercaptopyruvate sulfurtransferase